MTTQNQDRIEGTGASTSTNVGCENWPPHPGAVLREQINGIALETLCVNLATSPAALSLLLDEKIPLTAGIALRLSRTLPGRSFHEWMKIQNDHDLHIEELKLTSLISGHHFDLSHLLPADQKNKHGKAKMGKDFRRLITHYLTNQIEESINSQRKQAGLSPWKDRDFEKAFSLGTGNDAHSGRQWRRLKSKFGGSTTEDKIMQIKRFAEKNGWLPPTKFDISEDMVREFLETQNLHFLNLKKT
ncbi:TPA: transcriptional regulator [Burkholderia cenocepacia]